MKITGSILKEARERKNITLNEVAYATKINLRALQAIESGDVAGLPPKAFVRGFVQVYAEYLKIDVPSIMIQFLEEMGSTKPIFADHVETKDVKPIAPPHSAGQVVLDGRGIEDEMREGSSSLVKMAIFVVAILVVAVAIVAQKTFKKYESEKVSGVPAAAVSESTSTSVSTTFVFSDQAKPVNATKDTTQPTSGNTSLSNIVGTAPMSSVSSHSLTSTTLRAPPTTRATSIVPTTRAALTTTSDATTTSTVELKKVIRAKTPEAAAGSANSFTSSESGAEASAVVPKTVSRTTESRTSATTSTTLAAAPQEVILEALDQVNVTFRIDSGASQTLSLSPNQIHTFKAKGKVQLEVSDGGAVNIIHNGQDRGVPGTLGQSLKLRYP